MLVCPGLKTVLRWFFLLDSHPSVSISEVHYCARHLSHLPPNFNSILQLILCVPVVCLFVSALPQTCSRHLVVFSNSLSVLTSPPNEKQVPGIHWKKDNLSSHASAQAAGKLLNESITANTHFPYWIQSKPTFIESPTLSLSLSALI